MLGRGLRSRSARAAAVAIVVSLAVVARIQSAYYADAESLWRMTLALNPSCWTAHLHLAASLQERGRIDEAMWHYGETLKMKPDSVEALINLGQLEMDAGVPPRLAEAAAHLQTAIRIDPRAAAAHSNLGLVWLRMDRPNEAIQEQRLALRLRPDFAEVHCHLGLALEAVGDSEGAAGEENACQQNATLIARRLATGLKGQGDAAIRASRLNEAVAVYQQALRFAPGFAPAQEGLALALDRIRRGE
jgi:Flp pilus assembly protein TadD